MAITCGDVLNLKTFKNIKLLAGQEGLQRNLTWPYVGQTASVADWVHGGELLFITGVTHGVDDLHDVLQESIAKKLSGLVILVGEQYIKQIPQSLLEQANDAAFPLFEMPWKLRLIDVTREITDLIALDHLAAKRSQNFLSKLLFSDSLDLLRLAEEQALNEIRLERCAFIGIFNVSALHPEQTALRENFEEELRSQILGFCKQNNINSHALLYGNNIICLLTGETIKKAEKAMQYLKTVRELLIQLHSDLELYLSFGRIYESATDIRKSYYEARQALELCKKSTVRMKVSAYSELGIYRLLFKVNDTEEIRNFYHYHLDPIIAYDAQNHTELVNTLRQYLHCGCNISQTAQKLFIHRNTLLYRLNQIKDLLGLSLGDALENLNLFNSILAKEYLGE